MNKLKGLATGIGSLPCLDVETALELVFRYLPEIPFWPQLPKRHPREGMSAQFCENLPCLRVGDKGVLFDESNKEKELEVFYEKVINRDIEHFRISPESAIGLYRFHQRLGKTGAGALQAIKCHVTGPFTLAAGIKDSRGEPLLYDPVFFQALASGLAMKALWQIELLRKFGKKILLFIDEPYLGCFGSAFTPLNREDVVKGLSDLTAAIKSEDVLTGVHCCGNTDWSMLCEVPGLDIINFDAYGFLDRVVLYAENINAFLKRGGMLCWGMVPTQELEAPCSPASLCKRVKEGMDAFAKKGVDRGLLAENLLISPACGLGALEEAKAEEILRLTSELSRLLK